MTIFGMKHIKSINLLDSINSFLDFYHPTNGVNEYKGFAERNKWFMDSDYRTMLDTIRFQSIINDNQDTCFRINHSNDVAEGIVLERQIIIPNKTKMDTIYYFEAKEVEHSRDFGVNLSTQDLYVAPDHKFTSFIMNKQYILIWDTKVIRALDLKKKFCHKNLVLLDFQIDKDDPESFIKEVRTGSNPEIVVLIVQQSKDVDSVISWNVNSNTEFSCNDIEEEYVVIWDRSGFPYIVTPQRVFFCAQTCQLKTFDFQIDFSSLNQLKDLTFHKGHRLDGKNHNWIIF